MNQCSTPADRRDTLFDEAVRHFETHPQWAWYSLIQWESLAPDTAHSKAAQ